MLAYCTEYGDESECRGCSSLLEEAINTHPRLRLRKGDTEPSSHGLRLKYLRERILSIANF